MELTATVNAPVDDVWRAFTTDEGFSKWAAPFARIDLRDKHFLAGNTWTLGKLREQFQR
jgi:uncharacterized protein YndB with AHSA1/START domain